MKKAKFLLFWVLFLMLLPLYGQEQNLSLTDCIKIGLEQNPSLKKQEAKLAQSDAKTGEVASAQDFQINGSAYGMANTPKIFFNITPTQQAIITPNSSYNIGLTISKLISNFGFFESNLDLANLQRDTEKINLLLASRDLKSDITSAYIQLLRTQSLNAQALDTLDKWKAHLAQTKSLRKNGVVAGYDVLRVDVEISKAQEQLASAQKGVNLAQSTLASLMGYQQKQPMTILGNDLDEVLKPQTLNSLNLDSAYTQGKAKRLELQIMNLFIKQAESSLDIAKNSTNPTLNLSSTYNWKTATFMTQAWQWQTMLNLNLPIFNGREKPSQIRQAREAIKQADYSRDELDLKIALEIDAAWLTYQEIKQKEKTARTQLQQAQETLRVAKLRYQEGLSNGVERIDAQNQYNVARVNLENATYDYFLSVLNLKKSMGLIDTGEVI